MDGKTMPIGHLAGMAGKSAGAAAGNRLHSFVRSQIKRRGSEFVHLEALAGAEPELEEAIAVLRGDSDTLSQLAVTALKAVLSQRPSSYGNSQSRLFIRHDRVAALVKAAARRIVRFEGIGEELATARSIHAEIFDGDGIYGETLLEDAVRFSVLTLLERLSTGERLILENIAHTGATFVEQMQSLTNQLERRDQVIAAEASAIDTDLFDEAVDGEVRMLRLLRSVVGNRAIDRALRLGEQLEGKWKPANVSSKVAASREIASILARAGRPDDADTWVGRIEAAGDDATFEKTRIALARDQIDEAMKLVRDREEPVAKGLLLDAISRRDGEEAALSYYEKHYTATDLNGYTLLWLGLLLGKAQRLEEMEALLAAATAEQIADNPVLLFARARVQIAGTLPPDEAKRFMANDGLIPPPGQVRTDSEGIRRLDAACKDLAALRHALADIDDPDFLKLIDVNLLFIRLNRNDQEAFQQAKAELADRLSNARESIELAPLAVIYGVEFDRAPVDDLLAKAETLGGLDDTQLRAAFSLRMMEGSPQDILDFIGRHRDRLKPLHGAETIVSVEVEARTKVGDTAGARAFMDENRAWLSAATCSSLEATIAEAEGGDPVALRMAEFEKDGSTFNLNILINALGSARDERLGRYLTELWRRSPQSETALKACNAFYLAGQEQLLDDFLDELGAKARNNGDLWIHLAWARFRQGRMAEAADELKGLAQAGFDTANTRQLTLTLLVETGRWAELEPLVQKELAAESERSAAELMSIAQIAKAIGSSTTMDLVRTAIVKQPDDPALKLTGHTIALELGLDRDPEVGRWLADAIASSSEDGPIQMKDFDDVVAMLKEARERSDHVNRMVNSAEVPIFIALDALRATQSAFMLLQLPQNAAEPDSRRKSVAPLFAGNRLPFAGAEPGSVAFDPMALLTLDHLGLLHRAIDAFDDAVVPAGTLRTFFEDLGKSGVIQPSRIDQAKEIKGWIASDVLTVEDLPSLDTSIAEIAGDEFERLYAAAVAADGYVVDTAPLHPPGKLKEIVDPAPFASRLLSPTGLARSLQDAGALSRFQASDAASKLAGSGRAWDLEPEPLVGKPVFITNLAVQYLNDAGLLPALKFHAGRLVVLPQVRDFADAEIVAAETSARIRKDIERLRARLAGAIAAGRLRIGPLRLRPLPTADNDHEKLESRLAGPIVNALMDSGGVQAFVCDDRAINKYPTFDDRSRGSVALLTSVDLLAVLERKGVLDPAESGAAREKLRLAGAGLMPLDPAEMVAAVLASNWALGPSAELRAIRDSIHLPLARKVVQLPEERPWFKSMCLNVAFAIRKAWQEIDDPLMAERAATYLLDMLPDPETWSADDKSPDRTLWAQDVSRNSLWAFSSLFDLSDDKVEPYRDWFARNVEPRAERRDPGVMEAIGKTLFTYLATPMAAEDDDGDK